MPDKLISSNHCNSQQLTYPHEDPVPALLELHLKWRRPACKTRRRWEVKTSSLLHRCPGLTPLWKGLRTLSYSKLRYASKYMRSTQGDTSHSETWKRMLRTAFFLTIFLWPDAVSKGQLWIVCNVCVSFLHRLQKMPKSVCRSAWASLSALSHLRRVSVVTRKRGRPSMGRTSCLPCPRWALTCMWIHWSSTCRNSERWGTASHLFGYLSWDSEYCHVSVIAYCSSFVFHC